MERRLNFQYAMVHGAYWMYYGVISSFSSVFLLARGFSNSQIGLIIALGNIAAVIVQPFLADFADRSQRITVFTISFALTVVLIGLTVPLITLRERMLGIACCYVAAFALTMIMQPFCNALNRKLEETGAVINFGLCRSMGSLLYAVLVYALGVIVSKCGEDVIQPAGIAILSLLLLVLFVTHLEFGVGIRSARAAARTEVAREEKIDMRRFIGRHRMFLLVCAGTLGVYVANAVMNTYMAQIIANVGGDSKDLGTVFSVLAFLEIPTLVLFKRINKRFSCEKLLRFSGAAFVVWIGICALARNVETVIAAQFIQPFSFALFLPSMIAFIDDSMDRGEAVRGHTLFVATTTCSSIVASLAGGVILDRMGAGALLTAGTIIAASGAAAVCAAIGKAAAESKRERKTI